MYIWKNIHRLVDRFSQFVTYNIITETYSEITGLPEEQKQSVQLYASVQPVKKKGAIGGENEIYFNADATGNWETGAFIMISKSNFQVNMKDEIENLTINGKNYGNAFIDRIQDWSANQGHYKVRILLKSIYPTRESYDEYL